MKIFPVIAVCPSYRTLKKMGSLYDILLSIILILVPTGLKDKIANLKIQLKGSMIIDLLLFFKNNELNKSSVLEVMYDENII